MSQSFFGKIFPNQRLDWNNIYVLPRDVTVNTYLCNFQYKIQNYLLYLKKGYFLFIKSTLPLCLFGKISKEIRFF